MAARYQPVPLGEQMFDAANVNIVSAAINAALVSGSITSVNKITILPDGPRLITGQHLNDMGKALTALGKVNPLTTPSSRLAHGLHSGDVMNKMAAQMALY